MAELLETELEEVNKLKALERFSSMRGIAKIVEPTEFKDELDKARWEYLKKKHDL